MEDDTEAGFGGMGRDFHGGHRFPHEARSGNQKPGHTGEVVGNIGAWSCLEPCVSLLGASQTVEEMGRYKI
jgi:hypothetical protein